MALGTRLVDLMPKLLLIDGDNLAYRCFLARQNSPTGLLVNSEGVPITICSGFLHSLKKLIRDHAPTHLAIAFDSGQPTFRHELYPPYKANRKPIPQYQDFQIDLRNLKWILSDKQVACFSQPRYETEDIIHTIVKHNYGHQNLSTIIVSSDKDLLQLVNDRSEVFVYYKLGHKSQLYNESQVEKEYGIKPWQLADYKALVGHKGNNIPGVKGIGKISATSLLNKYQTVEKISQEESNLEPIYQKKLMGQSSQLLKFKQLTQLQTIPNFHWDLNCCHVGKIQEQSAIALELEL